MKHSQTSRNGRRISNDWLFDNSPGPDAPAKPPVFTFAGDGLVLTDEADLPSERQVKTKAVAAQVTALREQPQRPTPAGGIAQILAGNRHAGPRHKPGSPERRRELARDIVDRHMAQRLADEHMAKQTEADTAAVDALAAESIRETELSDLEPLAWLVDGLFYRDSVARVIGAGGTLKTFLMISVASCVARGEEWFGRATVAGPVVYVMAESPRGARARFEAYRLLRGMMPTEDVVLIPRPIQLAGPEWPTFVQFCQRLGASLVVLDTQAKMTEGLNENDAKDTGLWVGAAERLRRATGACVVLLHHTGHGNSERGRGSSAAYSGVDTEIMVRKVGGLMIEFKPIRQKEGDVDSLAWERLKAVPSGESIAVTNLDASDRRDPEAERAAEMASLAATSAQATTHLLRLARVLSEVFGGGNGATKAELKAAYTDKLHELGLLATGKAIPKATWSDVFRQLEAAKWLEQHPRLSSRFVLNATGCREADVPYRLPAWVDEEGLEGSVDEFD